MINVKNSFQYCTVSSIFGKWFWISQRDDEEFTSVKYAKCAGPKKGYDLDKKGGFRLDLKYEHVVDLGDGKSGYYDRTPECPKGYVVTGSSAIPNYPLLTRIVDHLDSNLRNLVEHHP